MSDKERGLYNKYHVERLNDPAGKHAECEYYVLDLVHDRHAAPALLAYAESCGTEFPQLAEDLRQEASEIPNAAPYLVDPESEAANPVWDLVVEACQQAWPEKLLSWNTSPTELIVDLINERDRALEQLEQLKSAWRPMVDAPLDGTEIEILIRHHTWFTALKSGGEEEAKRWQGAVRGKWIDHNGGGWTWHGGAGSPIGWRSI